MEREDSTTRSQGAGLQQLVHRHYVRSALITILAIDLVLVVLYFAINSWSGSSTRQALMEDARSTLQEITRQETRLINTRLQEVSRLAQMLQKDHENFFQQKKPLNLPAAAPEFVVHENGALYKVNNNGGASLYYSGNTEIGAQQLEKARNSEVLDPLLMSVVRHNPIVTQAYLNTWDGMNRLYPFIPEVPLQYGTDLHMQDYNFYYLADTEHNPSRRPVWTGTYLDPAGQGWMASCVVPIYRDNILEGVSGLDITVRNFVEQVLDLQLPWEGHAFMVDADGVILAMPPAIERLFNLRELKEHSYQHTVDSTVQRPQEYNLQNLPDMGLRQQFSDFMQQREHVTELQIGQQRYLLVRDEVDETGWTLMTLVDEATLFAPVHRMEETAHRIGFAALIAMLLFYLLFFAFLNQAAMQLASRIAQPLRLLADRTRGLGHNLESQPVEPVGIEELDQLGEHFNQMASQLEERTRKLIDSQTRIGIAEEQARVHAENALTDHLTGLDNRGRMEELLAIEIERSNHGMQPFAVLMIDVDHFKEVNDRFGHEAGDRVMIELARLFRLLVHAGDRIGRWGGEEFLLLSPGSSLHEAHLLAEKLRLTVAEHHFEEIGSRTISIGVALFKPGNDRKEVICRADKALYRAKHLGRNQVALDGCDSETSRA